MLSIEDFKTYILRHYKTVSPTLIVELDYYSRDLANFINENNGNQDELIPAFYDFIELCAFFEEHYSKGKGSAFILKGLTPKPLKDLIRADFQSDPLKDYLEGQSIKGKHFHINLICWLFIRDVLL